jgi:biopolymer transport protein ExbD
LTSIHKINTMAEMNIPEGKAHNGKVRAKKAVLRVDLTPMVDLAFLLITFFMLTTTLQKQKAMELTEPKQQGPQTAVSECQVLNLLTDSLGHIYYWEGLECKAVNLIALTGAHNLRDKIKAKKTLLHTNCLNANAAPKPVICLIKLLPGSRYDHMIRVLDEVSADSVPTYAIQAYSADELKAVNAAHQLSMN